MIGEGFWATGIVVCREKRGWRAVVEFYDDGWCEPGATEGAVRNRYAEPKLAELIDTILADAGRLGIAWKDPTIYVEVAPGNVLPAKADHEVAEQATRLGWRFASAA